MTSKILLVLLALGVLYLVTQGLTWLFSLGGNQEDILSVVGITIDVILSAMVVVLWSERKK